MKNLGNLLERAKLYMLNRLSQNGSRWPLPETFNGPSSIQYVIIVVMRIYAAAYVTLFATIPPVLLSFQITHVIVQPCQPSSSGTDPANTVSSRQL